MPISGAALQAAPGQEIATALAQPQAPHAKSLVR
jgi:hypothetical protein